MKLMRCEKGHFYDKDKYNRCPVCHPNEDENEEDRTPGNREEAREPREFYLRWKEAEESGDENRTVLDEESEKLIAHCFITGWLVCVEGPERGRDYRIRYGFNRIGRSHKMDICIFEDDQITRDVHCSIVYENKNNEFLLIPGKGSLTWKENELVNQPVKLSTGDRFRIGETILEFIAFCRDNIKWEM